ncbi:MAG: glycogen debranching enzyme GlgX [Comamonadaceae bacterium CG_4_9_14_3_um_filter_60_33]|nr:MAG: glycogen debranching enzyme GlgX [Comamonadaceae bacterium CG2_30_59_20]PIY28537.1 MAG: glycogen debranching enzyme GlgX [Comamonadaceae bacterium CG_4_10_14_3_um_filter_60_42]PJB41479.1 MAG: glycogen debranching enzyme GlgX [Comamonadaceae bacterium CG_4_9_14_3_um_filter_60_33]
MDSLTSSKLQEGHPWPLGAHFDGQGVNFAVFSTHAQAMELCLFDAEGKQELARLLLPCHTIDVWHGYLPGAQPGLVYGLRAHGPWRPDKGHRFDASKLLLDPYARDIVGQFDWRPEHFSPDRLHPAHKDSRDNAVYALKSRVTHDHFDWGDDVIPGITLADTVIYECHVKGFSKRNPAVPSELRGSYAGLAHPASIKHLKNLGVTAISLLPVQYSLSEERLVSQRLSNYWGYNTLGFFCVNPQLASVSDGQTARNEFRTMVRALHAAGLEVILDVVYNHTAEADESGPTVSFRGLDNASYYRLPPDDLSRYENYSGCGNTLNLRQPKVLQMVMDSLRYWVEDMHIDGFRFDLAPVLGRTDTGFSAQAAFFAAMAQDPSLSHVKMIAEPWDTGPGGYQVGGFPRGWLEWNDKFRDCSRRFWVQSAAAGDEMPSSCTRGDFAMRLCGSSDLYQERRRAPAKSVNYVVSHDGFTLLDLVSYNQRHNEANLEDNRDGHNNNLSFNCGEEGPNDDPLVQEFRARLQRVLLANTLLAQGTPMLCAGDELGHTQNGNNNPYCQDNATTWIDWLASDANLLAFTQYVIGLRHQLQPFANRWYNGIADASGQYDVSWWNFDGSMLQSDGWHEPNARTLACLIGKPGRSASPLLLLFNAGAAEASCLLPDGHWQALLDTSQPRGQSAKQGDGGKNLQVAAHSLMLLQQSASEPIGP